MRPCLPLVLSALLISGCSNGHAVARCFAPDTALPQRHATLNGAQLGASGRALAEALFDRDVAAAERLLDGDARLALLPVSRHHDMLAIALSSCDRGLVDLLLRHGADPNGVAPGVPLALALRMGEPWFAQRLLAAGASPDPQAGDAVDPLRTAIELNSRGGVRLLLDRGAQVNRTDKLGDHPLQYALDTERFGIAELLLDRGADPWATDSGGATLGWSVSRPPVAATDDEEEARKRLRVRLVKLGWPDPAPDPRAVRAAALDGRWPPVAGAPPVPAGVLAIMRENAGAPR